MFAYYLLGILGLGLLMVVHEGGHLLMARAYGMRVLKFSIGFGPVLFKIEPKDGRFWLMAAGDKLKIRLFSHDEEKHGPTVYQVALIPFLAYVQIAGMNPLEEIDPDDKGSYANARLTARIMAIFAGPAANYVFASLLFFVSFWAGGKLLQGTDVKVLESRPAAAAGMKTGDKIVEVAGVAVTEWEAMAAQISAHPGQTITIVVEREGARVPLEVTPASDKGQGRVGVSPSKPPTRVSVAAQEAALLALTKPPQIVKGLVVGLGQLLTRKEEVQLSGPTEMVKQTANAAKSGWVDLLEFLGILSAYLGAFNLIPFPALDGGRLLFLGYEAATRARPNAKVEASIHAIGLLMMLGLMFYVTVANDLSSLWK